MSEAKQPLKVLHTSDWHLGRRLYGHTRYEEFSAFLAWLYECIVTQDIDVLIVAGDIFDTMTPSNKAQTLYYEFLGKVSHSRCQHVIIVAGNHDSPSLLDAPKDVLKFLNVHIIGTACDNLEEEVITLYDKNNEPQAIVLAVPYLRDKDIRKSQAGESSSDKQAQVIAGISEHYAQVTAIAKQRQKTLSSLSASTQDNELSSVQQPTVNKQNKQNLQPELKQNQKHSHIPIIATGHLMAVGGKTTSDDGVRDLYVGSLGGVSANIFDSALDYVALGHLHVPQLVGGHEHIRYCGSPIAMGFGEANQQKQVLLVEFDADTNISAIKVPRFHQLAQIKGDLTNIQQQVETLKQLNTPIWLEIIYQSDKVISNLAEQLNGFVQDSQLEIIKIKNTLTYQRVLKQSEHAESLHDLTRDDVFERCLETHEVAEEQREALITCFQQVIYEIENEDSRAE